MLHFIYEQCINAFFKNLNRNFATPVVDKSLRGKLITAIEALIMVDGQYLRVMYSSVDIISTDDVGMTVDCKHGTMEAYPADSKSPIYTNSNFSDYIRYEDILEIIE
jgi:hypothetical protein